MNPNLIDLLRDALNIMRMRYQAAPAYDYGLPVFLAVMLGVGVGNAVAMVSLFGMCPAHSPRIPLLGYTLACEALALPNILVFYAEMWALPLSLWATWAFWAQAIGFYHISKQSVGKVFAVYVVYVLASMILMGLFLAMFVAEGWLDWGMIGDNVQKYMGNR